jgi:autotransporter-associated beta strand protein
MQTRDSRPVFTGISSKLLVSIGLCIAVLALSQTARGALVGYWNFDEATGTNVFDTAGNTSRTNNGFFATGAETPTRVTGRLGGAVGFTWQVANTPGAGRRVIVPYHTNLTLNNGPFTISYWYRMDAATPAGQFPGIMRIGSQSTTNGNNIGWGFFRTGNMVHKRGNVQPGVFPAMSVGQWYHLALHFNGNFTGTNNIAFLNGTMIPFATVGGWSNCTATTIFEMGRMDAFDQATLDDLALWGQEAIPAPKIRSLYTVPALLNLDYNLADMRVLWSTFDAGAGTTNVVKGNKWSYTATVPGTTGIGDAYINGGTMYVVLATNGSGVLAPLSFIGGAFSPGGVGNITSLALGESLSLSNASLTFDVNTNSNDQINITGDLNIASSTVIINPFQTLPAGAYRLFNYTGAKTGSLTLSNTTRYNLSLDESTPGQINLVVSGSPATLRWNSTTSGAWNLSISNWFNLDTTSTDRFYQGDAVVFDDSAVFQTNIVVGEPVFPKSIRVESATLNYSFTGTEQIGGAGEGLTKNNAGVLVLSTPNTFVGDVTVNAGTLRLGNAAALGVTNGGITIHSGATLDLSGNSPGTEAVTVNGAGVNGTGVVINTGAALSNNGLRGRVTLLGDSTFGGTARWDVFGGTLVGNGFKLTKVGTPEIALSNLGDTGLGDIDIQTGILTILGSTGMGNPANTASVNTNAVLAFWQIAPNVLNKPVVMAHNAIMRNATSGGTDIATNLGAVTINGDANIQATANIALLGVVSGAGNLLKVNTGTLYLGGANTYTGLTRVGAGRLALLNTGSIATSPRIEIQGNTIFDVSRLSGAYSVATGQTLTGSGSIHGSLALPAGGSVLPGVENIAATLTVTNGLALSGGTLTFDLTGAITEGAGVNDLINAGGNLDLTGTTSIIVNPLGILSVGNIYTLINYTGALSGAAANLSVSNNTRYTFALSTGTPGKVTLEVTGGAAADLFWLGGTPGSETLWDLQTTPNWSDTLGNPSAFFGGDKAVFDDFALIATVDLVGSLTPASIRVDNGESNYVFQGSGKLSGNSSLTKNFAAKLTIANTGVNDYVGPTAIEGGTLQVGAGGTAGNLGSGPITNNATLIMNRSDNVTLANAMLGAGNLIKSNGNVLILPTANPNYSGALTAIGGTIRPTVANALGNATGGTVIAPGATLDINAINLGDEQVTVAGNGVGGNGAIVNASTTGQNNALRFVTLTGNSIFGGAGRWDIRTNGVAPLNASLNTGGNSYSLTKVGANQVSLVDVAVDPALGDINVNAGTFSAEIGTAAGDRTRTVTVANNAVLQFFNRTVPWEKVHVLNGGQNIFNNSGATIMNGPVTLNATVTFNVAGTSLTVNSNISGSGALTKTGAGILILGSDNSYAGATTVSAGQLQLGTGTNAGWVAGPIVAGGNTLTVLRSDTVTVSNTLTGTGTLNVRTPGGLVIGNNTVNFATINIGLTTPGRLVLQPGFTGTIGAFSIGESPGGAYGELIQEGGNVTVSGLFRLGHWPNAVSTYLMGGGTFTQTATPGGVVNLGGQPEQPGVIYLGVDGTAVLVQTGGVIRTHGLVFDGRGNTAGTDTFILNGGEIILGPSGMKSGALDVNASYAINLGGGTITASANWTSVLAMTLTGTNGNVTFNTTNNNALTGALTGSGGLTKTGTGTLTLTGNDTYSGGTIVNLGTLSVRGLLGSGGGMLLVQGGTLMGDGIINGPATVNAGGTISPGLSIGTLTLNNSLSLAGNTVMEIAKTGSALTNDLITVSSALTYGGTLNVVNTGEPLSAGNSFNLFDAGSFSGSFTSSNLPALAPGLVWDTSQLAVNGTLVVGTRPLTYAETVQADGPIAYYRFSDALPVATNSGSLGAAANGTYNDNAAPGSEAPRPPTFFGFEDDNTALQLDGTGDFVGALSGLMNGKPRFTISGWMRRNGTQNNRTGLWGQNDIVEFGYIQNDTVELWTDNGLHVGPPGPIPDGQWAHFVVVSEGSPGTALIYTNGVLASTRAHVIPPDNAFPFNIGGGGIFDAIGVNGNYFNGQIDEVAVFDKALTANQISTHYFSTVASPPVFTSQPQSTNVFEGADVILSAGVLGSPPLNYQWLYFGEVIPNETASSLVFSNILEGQSGDYQLQVSNSFGVVLSDIATIIVTATQPPTITQEPVSITRYAGATGTLTVGATGGSLLFYQWQRNGANVTDATNASLTLSNLQPANAGGYTAIVSNSAGAVTSLVATVTVLLPVPGSHEQLVVSAGPMAFWRFNETNGTVAFDYYGGNDAIYTGGATNGPEAPRPSQFGGFESDNLAALFNGTSAYVHGPTGLMNSVSSFTMVGWIRRAADQNARTGLFGQNDRVEFGYIDNNTIQLWTDAGLNLAPNPFPNGNWAHVAVVGEGSPGTARLYTNGVFAASRTHTLPGATQFPFNIGGGGIFDGIGVNGNYFNGQIDEVAVFDKALTADQICALYLFGTGIGVRLSIERSGTDVILRWPCGTLQSTDEIQPTCPIDLTCNPPPPPTVWTDVPGATSPFPVTSAPGTKKFYRVRIQP